MKTSLRGLRLLTAALLFTVATPLWAGSVTPSASQGGVSWQINSANGGGTLTVSAPDGAVFERQFASGESPSYVSPSGVLPDGQYNYEVVLAPVVSAEDLAKAQDSTEIDRTEPLPPNSKESGSFRVLNGTVVLRGNAVEPNRSGADGPSAPDVTNVNDTLNINGFVPRLNFNDTSTDPNFATNNWQLRANESTTGGADFFGIVDQGPTATGDESGTIPFRIDAGAPTGSLRIASNGNVGLGTPAPAQDLHISKLFSAAIIRLQSSVFFPFFSARTWDIAANTASFQIQDITSGTTPFIITSSGNVGLGTSAPAGKLHVFGAGVQLSIFQSSDNDAVQFRLQTNSTNRRFVALNSAGTQQSQLVFGDNGAFDFLGATVADVRMKLLANGNVGIGTSTPDQKLSVNGNASKPGGGSWATFSDERLKNIKGEFKGGLDAVMKLQPVRYEYKDDNAIGLKSEGEHIGFGAAAVSEVIPEAVTRSENGYLMVDNDPILWTMLNAIKEQNAQITELKDQVKRLQAEVVLQAATKRPANRKVAKGDR